MTKQLKKTFIAALIAIVITGITTMAGYYFSLPAINIHSTFFWRFLIFQVGIFSTANYLIRRITGISSKLWKSFAVLIILILLYWTFRISSSPMFHAKEYASVLPVNEETDFQQDIVIDTNKIALMDTSSAAKLGDREIGSLANVVSQYNVSGSYTQINYQGDPVKVAPLEYAGFFKWKNNKRVPGYVMVDPVNMSADYCQSEDMVYVPSAYFGQNSRRRVQMAYPTKILYEYHFEIDEEGNPYYIYTTCKETVGMFGAVTVDGVILLNPCNGETTYYGMGEIPEWIDAVYYGNMLCTQYNWYGRYKNGYWNSIFAKKDCKKITDQDGMTDYGYLALEDDIWIYTGVTSLNEDSSNIGFLLANERTGEARYYAVSGADEFSAMSAAEGEVQEKGYKASFPSLISVDGVPTYIMVLKDNSGLVKLYAAVNVEQYNIVTTASSQDECIAKYKKMLKSGSQIQDMGNEQQEKTISISSLQLISVSGDTYLYVISTDQEIFRIGPIGAEGNEQALLLQKDDVIDIQIQGMQIISWEKREQS